jgi:hypothetical protein
MLDVISVALRVSFKFGKREVIWIESEKAEMVESSRRDFCHSLLVVIRHGCHSNKLKINLVLAMKIRTLSC